MLVPLLIILAAAAPPGDLLDRLVQRVRNAGPIERVERVRMIGQPMRDTSGTSAFRISDADLQQVGLSVELREPRSFARTGCRSRQDVFARDGPAAITQVPRDGSLDEERSFAREEADGRLSFGFAEKAPDYLSTVVFEGRRVAGRS